MSSLVHHFKAMGEFKFELQSGNAQFGSKSVIFLSGVTLKFDGLPWKTIGHLFYAISSFVHRFKAIGEITLELQSGNAQFRSNSAIFVPCELERHIFYAASSFVHHFIAISEFKLVRKRVIWVKIDDFFSRVTLKFDRWPWKTRGHLFYATSSFVHRFKATGEFKLELQSGIAQFGSKSTIFF